MDTELGVEDNRNLSGNLMTHPIRLPVNST